jgi:hypothetical protein
MVHAKIPKNNMIILLAIAIITASFLAVDQLAKSQRDQQWREWLNQHRPGIGPDGLDALGCKPKPRRKLKNILTSKR